MRKTGLIALAIAAACGGSSSNPTHFTSSMDGPHETPTNTSTATGSATYTVNGDTVNWTVTVTGLSGAPNNAHIHVGPAGIGPGGVVVPLPGFATATNTGTATSWNGSWSGTFTSSNVAAGSIGGVTITAGNLGDIINGMKSGSVYTNVHSAKFPGGEIRGQINPQ